MKKEKVFVKIRSEIAAGTRGSSLGIEAMEIAAINDKNTLFKDVDSVELADQNHLLHDKIDTPHAIRIEGLKKVLETLMNGVKGELDKGKFPIVLSGDHSNAAGTIAGVKAANPDKRVGVIWVDAHGDLHTPYTTPSGNMHGMPVAISLGADNLKNQINDISEKEKTISAGTQQSAIDYNVFEGKKVKGLPRYTLSRGHVSVMDGEVQTQEGHGKFVKREPNGTVNKALGGWKKLTSPTPVKRTGIPVSGV